MSSAPAPRDIAQWCAAQGWPVHPLKGKHPLKNCQLCAADSPHPHAPAGCPCIAAGGWCHSFHAATLDPARIDSWNPAWGVGVACGAAGLVVIDVDVHDKPLPDRFNLLKGFLVPDHVDLSGLSNGYHTLAVLAAYRGQTSPADDTSTLRVRTPSGGLHVWYRLPEAGPQLRCSAGSDARRTFLGWQVDVRANGGYIVAPGTRTGPGAYTPVPPATTPAPLPAWLLEDLLRTGHGPRLPDPGGVGGARSRRLATPPQSRRQGPYLRTLLAEVEACGRSSEGTGFSAKLNRAAWTAGGLVAGGLLDSADAQHQLAEAAYSARPQRMPRNLSIIDAAFAQGELHPILPKGHV